MVPLITYFVRAKYEFDNVEYPEVGIFECSRDGVIKGHMMEPRTHCPRFEIEGKLAQINEVWCLNFVQKSPDPERGVPRKYFLTKSDGRKDIEGKYVGTWEATEDCFLHAGKKAFALAEGDKRKARLTLDLGV